MKVMNIRHMQQQKCKFQPRMIHVHCVNECGP